MNEKPKTWKILLGGVCAGVLVAGTLAAATPAVAAAQIHWAKIWRAELMPKADKRYQPETKVLRGAIALSSTPTGGYSMAPISFGITLNAPPTAHVITAGDPVPAGCSGTPAAPSASRGHLCIFLAASSGFSGPFICSATNDCTGRVSRFGGYLFGNATGSTSFAYGSWALRVGAFTTARLAQPSAPEVGGGSPGGK